MLFNSFSYILFLWTVYVLFWTWRERRSLRHVLLLVASYWFYAQADWRFTSLLLISTVVDFVAGQGIDRARAAGEGRGAKRWLALSLVTNLGLLSAFKYFNFFVDSFGKLLGRLGSAVDPALWLNQSFGLPIAQPTEPGGLTLLAIALPVGISFYTFQTLSYTLDIYRGKMRATTHFLDFAVFVSFFPQLVAGPIVRAVDFMPQLATRPVFDTGRLGSGLFQILRGMTKKLLMADMLGAHIVDLAYRDADTLGQLGGPGLLLATYAYALQLYGDFAGYSDIAIGSARVLGFELKKNFDAPFKSRSLEEFWGRWHISMSSWFTDYVYIGLGGSRLGVWKACRNAMIAWTLVGLWHGAAWTFVLWGAYHGAWLVITRLVRQLLPDGRMPAGALFNVLGVIFTFHVVAFSMVLFRCRDLGDFGTALAQLGDWSRPLPHVPWQIGLIMVLGYLTHFMPDRWLERTERGWINCPAALQGAVLTIAMLLFFALRPPGLVPFVYFQF